MLLQSVLWRNKQKKMEKNNNNEEWISVSEMAKRLNCSQQTVYNRMKQQLYEVRVFQRGKMRGFLIRVR